MVYFLLFLFSFQYFQLVTLPGLFNFFLSIFSFSSTLRLFLVLYLSLFLYMNMQIAHLPMTQFWSTDSALRECPSPLSNMLMSKVISILLRGEGHSRRAESVLQNCECPSPLSNMLMSEVISILLRGEGHLHRAESVLQNCVMGRCAICIFMYCYRWL